MASKNFSFKKMSDAHSDDTQLPSLPYQHSWEISELLKTMDPKEKRRWGSDPVYIPTLQLLSEDLEEIDEMDDNTKEEEQQPTSAQATEATEKEEAVDQKAGNNDIDDSAQSSPLRLKILGKQDNQPPASIGSYLPSLLEAGLSHFRRPQLDILLGIVWLLAFTHGLYIWRIHSPPDGDALVAMQLKRHLMAGFWASIIASCVRRIRSTWKAFKTKWGL
ncbi:hypothetical protein AUEXF2481DRAFT_44162 [Aureobasidium subglaciale EXF-2481]|uniref:Uncharacterized protein n=1 Tax=Aureobasidium subglaciale (strain EXF-2481) TaxID=1043005 RepID=A0A074Y0M8_AURSE|nr:uncharacterized protein AUEXF2481DRAFT_44162 [Aureobasidium subglaciale EXF-2481]KEQ91353.1 hypothetical protein AUEXF2481DRAFT_44162 [Aureobasidium subglaciale EXF-2481]